MIYRGVPLPFMFFLSCQWGHWISCLGGWGARVLCLCFYVLFIAVLVLAVFCFPFLVVPHIGRVLFLVLHAVVGGV